MLEIEVDVRSDGTTVVLPIGDLDLSTAPTLRERLLRIVTDAGSDPRVVIDLAGVDFLDTIGLGALLGGVKRCREAGGELAVARAEPQVAAVFTITRVDEVLPLHGSVESAIEALGSDRDDT